MEEALEEETLTGDQKWEPSRTTFASTPNQGRKTESYALGNRGRTQRTPVAGFEMNEESRINSGEAWASRGEKT